MVPHRQALRALALVAASRADSPEVLQAAQDELRLKFPCQLEPWLNSEVYGCLPPALEAEIRTTDFVVCPDYRPLFAAARILGVSDIIVVGANGPELRLPDGILKLRTVDTLRIFIESCWMSGISQETIIADLRAMYGVNFEEADIVRFLALFADREYLHGDHWIFYEACIGNHEAIFKRQLFNQPHEYVRWKLGVNIVPNSDRILDRMIADAYFTERQLKAESGNDFGKDEMARVKMERDTIFKAIDRKLKLKESSGGSEASDAKKALSAMIAKYDRTPIPLKSDVVGDGDLPVVPPMVGT